MSTTLDIVTQALPTSSRNRPVSASDDTEYRLLMGRLLRQYGALGARLNPAYFGKSADVVGVAGVWARPSDAELVYRIETAAEAEVVVVPLDERAVDYGKPRLYQLGRDYRTAGDTADPGDTDTLTFYYARQMAVPAAASDALDALWPTAFDPLLVADVALYLAVKDGRQEEVAGLTAIRDGWLALYTEHLTHETTVTERRFQPERFLVPVKVPDGGKGPDGGAS